ncbi:MAG TPA: DNA repair protein RecN [Firmicutes bacterium]|nr:DNA repair protein RecN [Bacillota bacterium]
MLTSLHIENIAVIERADIEPQPGLNVLTGETGAGKSMVIDAINAVLGERISRDAVRTGSQEAKVTALFSEISAHTCALLEELGYPPDEDGQLLIQRTISAEGKGSCRVNGQPATVAVLRSLGRLLVNIHGQHENQALLAPEKHVDYLERLGGLLPLHAAFSEAYQKYTGLRRRLEQTAMDEGAKAQRLDILRFQIDEIEAAALRPGEEEELKNQRELYRHAEKIAVSVAAARELLSGGEEGEGAVPLLSRASDELREAGRYVGEMAELSGRVESLLYELEECGNDLRDFASHLEFEPGELERVEERLDQIRRLLSKYGADEQAVLDYGEQARQELEGIELSDERAAGLRRECAQAYEAAREAAQRLSDARKAAAADFSKRVGEELAFLDMPGVRLEVQVEPAELGAGGIDRVEFRIAANPGEPPKPIAKIASGGELSRIMLAIKSVMADVDDIDTLIFDEIDAGISGRAAWKVGVKLRQIGRTRQVICVTHLAQIAAQAHHHFLIAKRVQDSRTFTGVAPLDRESREKELARIIGGEPTPAALEAARELLERTER